MIDATFCFLSGVGLATERGLWRDGLTAWSDFLKRTSIRGIGPARKRMYDECLLRAREHRARDDARYFGTLLHHRDQWRLYEWLRARAVYLDIETNSFGQITVVGLYGRGQLTSLIRGESLTRGRLHDELRHYDLLVTFCGASFDLPMLVAQFPDLPLDHPHIDLCLLGRQLGYRGGLKAIEGQLRVTRALELQGLKGRDAVRLWNRWRHRRDAPSKERLVAYNAADCMNLEPIADTLYCEAAIRTLNGVAPPSAASSPGPESPR